MSFDLHPRLRADTFFVAALPLCDALLMNDANYPWLILVPRVPGMREVIDLEDRAQGVLMREIAQASRALQSLYSAYKLNVAALGNQVPQLHVHVIARQTDDVAWPQPVFGRAPARPYDAAARELRLHELRTALGAP